MGAPAGSQSSLAVGLNLVFLVPGETGGMEVYARELITAMRELPDAPQLTAFLSREAAQALYAFFWLWTAAALAHLFKAARRRLSARTHA